MKKRISIQSKLLTKTGAGEEQLNEYFIGEFLQRGDLICLKYDEPNNQGLAHLRIMNDRMVLSRKGLVQSEMVFKLGETTALPYQTPQGLLQFQLHTVSVHKEMQEASGRILVVYHLCSGKEVIAENHLEWTWHEEVNDVCTV